VPLVEPRNLLIIYDAIHSAVNTSIPVCCHLKDRFNASRQIKHRPLLCQKNFFSFEEALHPAAGFWPGASGHCQPQ
jgi:hypothetical protein